MLTENQRNMILKLDTKGPDEPSICNVIENKEGKEYISTLSWKKDGAFIERPNNAPNNIVYNEKGEILSQNWCQSSGEGGLFDEYMHNTYGPASIFTIEIDGEFREKFFYYLKGVCQNSKIETFIKENNIETSYSSGKELDKDILELYLLNYGN